MRAFLYGVVLYTGLGLLVLGLLKPLARLLGRLVAWWQR